MTRLHDINPPTTPPELDIVRRWFAMSHGTDTYTILWDPTTDRATWRHNGTAQVNNTGFTPRGGWRAYLNQYRNELLVEGQDNGPMAPVEIIG